MNFFPYEAIPTSETVETLELELELECNNKLRVKDIEMTSLINNTNGHTTTFNATNININRNMNVIDKPIKKYAFHIIIKQILNLNRFQIFQIYLISYFICSIPIFLYMYLNKNEILIFNDYDTYNVYVIRHADQKYIKPYKVYSSVYSSVYGGDICIFLSWCLCGCRTYMYLVSDLEFAIFLYIKTILYLSISISIYRYIYIV